MGSSLGIKEFLGGDVLLGPLKTNLVSTRVTVQLKWNFACPYI